MALEGEAMLSQAKLTGAGDAIPLQNVSGEVELLGVSFRYDRSSPLVLRNVSLYVRPGETVALVGASGGGRTTLAKLLLRLCDPIYGLNLKVSKPRNSSPCQLTVISAHREVILSSTAGTSDEFIQKLSNGYSVDLEDRASSLSGEQRQRLVIARALYQDVTILILDEATLAFDNKSEILVREALEGLMADRTVFVIARRLETVRRADRILLSDGGKIVEEGTDLSLVGQGGKYAALYTRQESSLSIPEALAPQ